MSTPARGRSSRWSGCLLCVLAGGFAGGCGHTGSMYESESMRGMTWGDTNRDMGSVDSGGVTMGPRQGEAGPYPSYRADRAR